MSFIQLCDKSRHDFTDEHGRISNFTPNMEVIAYALCFINRFTGHAGAYSVAQHSIHVYEQAKLIKPYDYNFQLSALLHDATEAYINDISSPLKTLLPDYKKIEDVYHQSIDNHYGTNTCSKEIKAIDLKILATEAKSFGFDLIVSELGSIGVSPHLFEIKRKNQDEVYNCFMAIFNYLKEQCYS